MAMSMDLHFVDCLWAGPLLEHVICTASTFQWPAPVQARLVSLISQRPALNTFNTMRVQEAAVQGLRDRLMLLLHTLVPA
jgi:hypothetical protein